ncbi:MAG: hypothetical protein R3C17_05470 [Planctomycetaceae bacterium]
MIRRREASGRNDSAIPIVADEVTSPSQPGTRDLIHYGHFFSAARLIGTNLRIVWIRD